MDFYEVYAGKIPIPKISTDKQQEFVSIINKIVELSSNNLENQQEIEALEAQFNKLVYNYYKFSSEETTLIENNMV